jgi:hypothetical protein
MCARNNWKKKKVAFDLKETNLAVARRTVKVLSPIFKPLRAPQAMSVTAGS